MGGVSTHPSGHRVHPSWLRVARKSGASRAGQQSVQARALPVKNDDSLLQGCRAAEIQGMACLTRGLLQVNAV